MASLSIDRRRFSELSLKNRRGLESRQKSASYRRKGIRRRDLKPEALFDDEDAHNRNPQNGIKKKNTLLLVHEDDPLAFAFIGSSLIEIPPDAER